MAFKYAMCNELFEGWSLEKQFDFVAECGYEGMELAPFTITPTDNPANVLEITDAARTKIRNIAKNSGVQIVGLHWLLAKTQGFHLTHPDADIRKKTVEYGKALIELCADLGGNIMIWGSPKQRNVEIGVTRDQAYEFAADALSELVPVLEKNKITIAMEPLAPAETNFLASAMETLALVQMVKSPWLQMMLDCKAMWGAEINADGTRRPMEDVIRQFRPWTRHFHANDPNLQGPGFGELDFHPLFKALKETQFDGWVSVEVFDYTPGAEALTKKSIDYMKKVESEI